MTPPLTTVILAGGLATRLRPVSETIPKALIEINGVPFLEHQLRLLERKGVRQVVLCVGYLGERVQDFAGDGSQFGLRIQYSFDGDRLLGTAGAIRRALPLLPECFLTVYGDSYLDCDYSAVTAAFLKGGKDGLMTVYRNQGRWDASNVEFAGGRILQYDKRQRSEAFRHIDYGLGAFRRSVFQALPEAAPSDLADVYRQLLAADQLTAFEVFQRFYETGSFSGIEELGAHLKTMNGSEERYGVCQ